MPRRKAKKAQAVVDGSAWAVLGSQLRPIFVRGAIYPAIAKLDRLLLLIKAQDYLLAREYIESLNPYVENLLLGDDYMKDLVVAYCQLSEVILDMKLVVQMELF